MKKSILLSLFFLAPSVFSDTAYTSPSHPLTAHPEGYLVDANGERWFREGVRFHYEIDQNGQQQKIFQKCHTAKVHYGDPLDSSIEHGELPSLDCVLRKLSPDEDVEVLKNRSFVEAESAAASYLEAREQYNIEAYHERHAGERNTRDSCKTYGGAAQAGSFGAWTSTLSYTSFAVLHVSTSWTTPGIVLQTQVRFTYEGETHEEYWTDKNKHSIWVNGKGALLARFQATYYTPVIIEVCV